jgi:tetratricopeptide (TPR) repeat protein
MCPPSGTAVAASALLWSVLADRQGRAGRSPVYHPFHVWIQPARPIFFLPGKDSGPSRRIPACPAGSAGGASRDALEWRGGRAGGVETCQNGLAVKRGPWTMSRVSIAGVPPELAAAFEAGRHAEVLGHFQSAPPATAEEWLLLGRAKLALGQAAEALECFQHDRASAAGSPALAYYAACAQARLGRWRDAEASLGPCLAEPDWRARALRTRAQARVRAGLWAEAEDDYRALSALGQITLHDHLGWAACLVRLGRCDQAEPLLDALLARGGTVDLAWWLKGRCREGLGGWGEAAQAYSQGLERFPDSEALAARLLHAARRPSARRPETALRFLAGRQRLLAAWTSAQAERPAEPALAHRIALLASFTAGRLQADRPNRAREFWTAALSNWAVLLENREWLDRFVAGREAVYGRRATALERAEFLRLLEAQVERFLETARGDQPRVGEPSLREQYLRERHAVRALQDLGWPPSGGPGESFACGPLLLGRLKLADRLEAWLAHAATRGPQEEGRTWDDPAAPEIPARRIRLLFSALGFAQVRLERADYEGARDSLRWAVCTSCAAAGSPVSGASLPVCRAECPEFGARNPGLAALPARGAALAAAAEWLALQAEVGAVARALSQSEPDPERLGRLWRAVRARAGGGRRGEALGQHLNAAATAAARALASAAHGSAAVAMLEAVLGCEPGDATLQSALAVALTNHGIDLANAGNPIPGAVALRRALTLSPHLVRARVNLIRVLHAIAHAATQESRFEAALTALEEADAALGGAGLEAEETDLREQTAALRIHALIGEAGAAHTRGDPAITAALLEKAAALGDPFPASSEPARLGRQCREYLSTVCRQAAFEASQRGDEPDARRWTERAEAARITPP